MSYEIYFNWQLQNNHVFFSTEKTSSVSQSQVLDGQDRLMWAELTYQGHLGNVGSVSLFHDSDPYKGRALFFTILSFLLLFNKTLRFYPPMF